MKQKKRAKFYKNVVKILVYTRAKPLSKMEAWERLQIINELDGRWSEALGEHKVISEQEVPFEKMQLLSLNGRLAAEVFEDLYPE